MKQVKEGLHAINTIRDSLGKKDETAPTKSRTKSTRQRAVVPKKDEAKVNLPDEDKHLEVRASSRQEGEGEENQTGEELESDLQVKEALYLSNLSHECYDLRRQVEDVLNNHLRSLGIGVEKGNKRQNQIRQMSWSFLTSLERDNLPKGFQLLPCALNGAEVYQYTHLIQAFCLALHKLPLTIQEDHSLLLTPLVKRTEDKMQVLEARKALYEYLLSLTPRQQRAKQTSEREPTHKELYTLLLEVRDLLLKGERSDDKGNSTKKREG